MENFINENIIDENIIKLIDEYGLLDDNLSHKLYAAIINKFDFSNYSSEFFMETHNTDIINFIKYKNNMFYFIDYLHDLSDNIIWSSLDFLYEKNPYIPDIIFMLWCLPYPHANYNNSFSKQSYDKKYKQNITNYNNKIISHIDNKIIKNFCIETLTKNNNVPVHCIDYIWYYMNTISIELVFYNYSSSRYIGVTVNDSEYIIIGMNIEYILLMGLGEIVFDEKGSFKCFLKKIFSNVEIVEKMLKTHSSTNFKKQLKYMIDNQEILFKDCEKFPANIINLLN